MLKSAGAAGCALDQQGQPAQPNQRQRPQPDWLKPQSGNYAKDQRDKSRPSQRKIKRALQKRLSAYGFKCFAAGVIRRRLAPGARLAGLGFRLSAGGRIFARDGNCRWQQSGIKSDRGIVITVTVATGRAGRAIIPVTPGAQAAARTVVANKRIFGRFIRIGIALILLAAIILILLNIALGAIAILLGWAGLLLALVAAGPIIALRALIALRAGKHRLVKAGEITCVVEIVAVITVFARISPTLTRLAGALFFLAHAGISQHAEIVIGELQVIFGLDPVPIEMGIVRLLAILFEQLGRVAARPAVNPVELLATTTTAALLAIATPTTSVVVAVVIAVTAIAIIIQRVDFPNTWTLPVIQLAGRVTLCHGRPLRFVVPTSAA